MSEVETEKKPAQKIREWMHENKVTLGYEFVPFSKSRSASDHHKSLNWKVTLRKDGRDVVTTDYMAGLGHCPAYKLSVKEAGERNSIMRHEMIARECENGHAARPGLIGRGEPIVPNDCDVLASLAMDSDVIDARNFEEWAGDLGYDTDSRKAETIYKACMDIALSLRRGLGEKGLASLREAVQDY